MRTRHGLWILSEPCLEYYALIFNYTADYAASRRFGAAVINTHESKTNLFTEYIEYILSTARCFVNSEKKYSQNPLTKASLGCTDVFWRGTGETGKYIFFKKIDNFDLPS